MNRVVFQAKPLTEDVIRVFDFTSLLAEGETLAAAVVDVDTFSGVDSSPDAILSGNATVDGPRVSQEFTGGTLGATYTVTCIAGTCNDQQHSLGAYLAVVRGATE